MHFRLLRELVPTTYAAIPASTGLASVFRRGLSPGRSPQAGARRAFRRHIPSQCGRPILLTVHFDPHPFAATQLRFCKPRVTIWRKARPKTGDDRVFHGNRKVAGAQTQRGHRERGAPSSSDSCGENRAKRYPEKSGRVTVRRHRRIKRSSRICGRNTSTPRAFTLSAARDSRHVLA